MANTPDGSNKRPLDEGDSTPATVGLVEIMQTRSNRAVTSSFQGLLTKWATDVAGASEEAIDKSTKETNATLQQHKTRIESLETFVDKQQATNENFEAKFKELHESHKHMAEQLVLANKAEVTREDITSDAFERPPDLTLLRINAHKFVTKISVEDAICPWLVDAGIETNLWKLEGSTPTGRNFTLKFLLNPLSAARQAAHAFSLLKDEDGNWKKFEAKLATGEKTQLHIGKDESPKMRTVRFMGKALLSVLEELYPDLDGLHFRGIKGAIFAKKEGICRMEPTSSNIEQNYFKWNNPVLVPLGIDKERVKEVVMQRLAKPEDQIQWSL